MHGGVTVGREKEITILPQTAIEGGTILPQNDALFSFKMLQNRKVNLNLRWM